MTEATATGQHWLTKYSRPGSRYPFVQHPCHVTAPDGRTWTVATDGYTLIALLGAVPGFTPLAETPTELLPFLPGVSDLVGPVACDPARLKEWAGPALWPTYVDESRECDDCNGKGRCSHCDQECQHCDGEGRKGFRGMSEPDPRPGILAGVIIDRTRLARLLEPFDASQAVQVARSQDGKTVCVDMPDSQLAIVGMEGSAAGVDVFGTDAVGDPSGYRTNGG